MRPDISIWRDDEVVAGIECKTQFGWNRHRWLPDFEQREKRLANAFPHAALFLLVLTSSNWSGFGDDRRAGNQFFVLLNDIWPNNFEASSSDQAIVHPIERLVEALLVHVRG